MSLHGMYAIASVQQFLPRVYIAGVSNELDFQGKL